MKIPVATYRLQFNHEFNFESASKILEYLKKLGISDIYASSILKSKKGSPHGYDLIDPAQVNPELGGEIGFIKLVDEARSKGLGWLQDVVANHMSYDSQNIYLMDLLENGEYSRYRDYFDIDWNHPQENLNAKALAPFLAEFYGTCLDEAQIQLIFFEGSFSFRYQALIFPMRIEDYPEILKSNIADIENRLGKGHGDFLEFLEIIGALERVNGLRDHQQRYKLISDSKTALDRLCQKQAVIKENLDNIFKVINGQKNNPSSLDKLDKLLSKQNFRFSFWKVGNDELNYRRFFTINELISLKMQNEDVFNFISSTILRLVHEGKITGLRIDHLDGLYDPLHYLSRIKEKSGDTYIIVEKILALFEIFPEDMPIEGSTGYDYLNFLNGIFIEKKNEKKFDKIYSLFIENNLNYIHLLKDVKRVFIGEYMAGDIDNLARPLHKLLSRSRYGKDFTMYALKRGIVEMLAHFSVYRTYITAERINPRDETYIKEAAAGSKNDNPGLLHELEIIERVLLFNRGSYIPEEEKWQWNNFTRRFQQLSCSVMAKGLEDTFFYIYNRFISLNEVGGNPSIFGIDLKDFHEFNTRRQSFWPYTMNATSTHDTKIGEDVHCRLNVLSEIPREWGIVLTELSKINKVKKRAINKFAPDKNDEFRIYQVLVGAFPFFEEEADKFRERMKIYIVKAVREAKIHTDWLKPELLYEEACINFIDQILDPQKSPDFFNIFLPFQRKIAYYGIFNSLSQIILKMCSPGIADIYRGSELWDLNLVDPDNRNPVDFEKRSSYLSDIINKEQAGISPLITELFSSKEDGRIKLFLLYKLLKIKNTYLDIFQKGSYVPLRTGGKFKKHVVAFLREYNNLKTIVVAPRFFTSLIKEGGYPLGNELWQDTFVFVPGCSSCLWRNVITEEEIQGYSKLTIGNIFKNFPGAVLMA